MTWKVAALYRFVALPDFREIREPLLVLCARFGLKGSVLLASEGLNGTLAGEPAAIDAFVDALVAMPQLSGRLDRRDVRFSTAAAMPFKRLKVRLKREIVTLGVASVDPTKTVGTYVDPGDWNAFLDTPGLVLIDTRNAFEVAHGTFMGAIDPGLRSFGDFPVFAAEHLDPERQKTIAMFCTGGIRCEKASSYLLGQGFEAVYHLKGGILNYLETVPKPESRWSGACFVFDERVSLDHGLEQRTGKPEPEDA